jgi:hypothetical protein
MKGLLHLQGLLDGLEGFVIMMVFPIVRILGLPRWRGLINRIGWLLHDLLNSFHEQRGCQKLLW